MTVFSDSAALAIKDRTIPVSTTRRIVYQHTFPAFHGIADYLRVTRLVVHRKEFSSTGHHFYERIKSWGKSVSRTRFLSFSKSAKWIPQWKICPELCCRPRGREKKHKVDLSSVLLIINLHCHFIFSHFPTAFSATETFPVQRTEVGGMCAAFDFGRTEIDGKRAHAHAYSKGPHLGRWNTTFGFKGFLFYNQQM